MILILSGPTDVHVTHVAAKLRDRGASFMCFDPKRFPSEAAIAVEYSRGDRRHFLASNDTKIDLSQVRTTWYRRPEKPAAHSRVRDPTVRNFIDLECYMVMQDLWHSLECAWLPAQPFLTLQAERKMTQLALATKLGFKTPATLVTNSPDELLEFYRQHDGHIISKQSASALTNTVGHHIMRYTELVSPREVAHAHDVALCPMTFQEYVPKQVELRITVVGDRVFAAAIHSQATYHTRHDWRCYDHGKTPHTPHALPEVIEGLCLQLCRRMALRYGAIDMVLTPDGRYVFLEINPNGQYLWIEQNTGQPISDAICDLLMAP